MYTKTEGDGLVPFYHVNYVNVYLGGQMERGALDRKNKLGAYLCSICPSTGVPNVHKVKNLPLVRNKEHVQNAFF